jgi:uncharacterized protein YbjT (DUF2867 family)
MESIQIIIHRPSLGGLDEAMTNPTVLITGGTGRSGRRVADRVRASGAEIRIGSRSAAVPFDWHRSAEWAPVLSGCSAAYLCYSPDLALPGADDVMAAFTAAATRAGVNRLVLLSGRGEPAAARCERIVLGASADATVVRCSWFQENFSEHFLRDGVLAGRIAVPAGRVTEPFVSLDDVADVAALALTGDARAGEILELTGPESIGFGRAARLLSLAVGREIAYEAVTGEAFVAEMVSAGADQVDAEGMAWLFDQVLDGRNSATTDTNERVLGRPATSFQEYAVRAAAAGRWTPVPARVPAGRP